MNLDPLQPRPILPELLKVAEWQLAEMDALPLVNLSLPMGGEEALVAALDAVGLGWPAPGQSTGESARGLLRMGGDQALVYGLSVEALATGLGDMAWLTDQSDTWVGLSLRGSDPRAALAYLCALDLDEAAFPDGATARTRMAHLSVILLRQSPQEWWFWAPRSSVESFIDALVEALELASTTQPAL